MIYCFLLFNIMFENNVLSLVIRICCEHASLCYISDVFNNNLSRKCSNKYAFSKKSTGIAQNMYIIHWFFS